MKYPDIEFVKNTRYTKPIIKKDYPDFYQYIEKSYPESLQWKQKLYWFYHNINDYPRCPICGRLLEFLDFTKGYRKYCSCKCASMDPEYRESIKQTCLKKYGCENAFQNKEIQEKYKQTMIKNYGVDNPHKSEEITNRIDKTVLEKYGVRNVRYYFTDIVDDVPNECGEYKRKCPHPECTKCKEKYYWADIELHGNRVKCKTEMCTRLLPRTKTFNQHTSIEIFIQLILNTHNIDYIANDRSILNGKEIDIYIPSKKIAIECNGIYWHSIKCKFSRGNDYHFNKWNECRKKHIELLTIWEFEIWETPEMVKNKILKKLGLKPIDNPIPKSDEYISSNDFDFIPEGYKFVKMLPPEEHEYKGMKYYDSGHCLYRKIKK